MKKRFQLIFILLIILGLGGCEKTQPPPASTEQSLSPTPSGASDASDESNESPMSTYKSILENKTQILSVDANKELNISQLNQAVSDDESVKVVVSKFAIVDLDNDDMEEIVLWLIVNDNDDYGFEVLRYKDGVVYGYTLSYRSFMDLKDDGTFSYSSGAMDYGFGRMEFTDSSYTIDKISYCESSEASDNEQEISYYVNQESATEEDFLAAINKQSEKTGITWYDYNDENIETLLSE